MKTLDLESAAKLVKLHPVTLHRKVKAGEIPAAKPGKRWVFIEEDLIEWLRSQYNQPRHNVSKEAKCSTKEVIQSCGGLNSPTKTEKLYADLLELKTEQKPRN